MMNNNYNSNTVVDGRAAHVTDTTRQSAPEHPPRYQIMLDPSLGICTTKTTQKAHRYNSFKIYSIYKCFCIQVNLPKVSSS